MRFLRIDDAATIDDLTEAVGHLRDKQRRVVDEQVYEELSADIDELIRMILTR